MTGTRVRFPLAFLAFILAGCGPLEDLRERLEPDLTPPVLEGLRVRECWLELDFTEAPVCSPEEVRVLPELAVSELQVLDRELRIAFPAQVPGLKYTAELAVADGHGNRLEFTADFYGWNPRAPSVLINEFTTRGSDTHPDLVELVAASPGDMAGVTLCQGTAGSWDDRFVFPSFPIRTGQFLLVHFKPQGIPDELDEPGDSGLSGGLDASPTAFDFWVPGGRGLSGNNGVLAVYDRPGGVLADGVLYSNRTSASDSQYRGFGSAGTLARAEELVREGGWLAAQGEVRPEDAVDIEPTTATRSLNRSSGSDDTNCPADWHVVPTRGSTFGTANSDERYVP